MRTKAKAGKRAGEETAFAQDRVELAIGSALAGGGGKCGGGDWECGVAQVALLVFGGGVAGLPFLPLSAFGGALSLLATITARTAVARSVKTS